MPLVPCISGMHRLVTCCQGAASSSDNQSDLAMQAHRAAVQVSLLLHQQNLKTLLKFSSAGHVARAEA